MTSFASKLCLKLRKKSKKVQIVKSCLMIWDYILLFCAKIFKSMVYTTDSHITTVKDVEAFFHHIVLERKVNFYPDNMFEDYVSCGGGISTFTLAECAI